jgi:integrase
MDYKRNKDGYFRKTITIKGEKTKNGNPKRIIIREIDKKVFKKKIDEVKRLYGIGISIEDETVSEWGERWYAIYKANATDTQKAHYRAKLDNDILPVIGSMLMRDVRSTHLQELLNQYEGGRVGTVTKICGAIKQLFEDAVTEGLIERNPAARLELPEMTETVRRPLREIERIAVYEVAKTHIRGAYVLTMLFCGFRLGEDAGLLVEDVDFNRLRINITKSLSLRKNIGTISTTKAAKLRKRKVKNSDDIGKRYVPIPDLLLPFLEKQCEGKSPKDILFSREDGTFPTKQAARCWWKSFKRQCHIFLGTEVYRNQVNIETSPFGDNITPHYLRHTFSTDLFAAGVDEATQKFFLGHASSDVTDIYRKMNDAAFNRALGQMNEYYSTLCLIPPPERMSQNRLKYCLKCPQKSNENT